MKDNDLPYGELLGDIKEILNNQYKNSRAKQHARNAINHLEKAWTIREIDKEMALFRAITAEEEAATALLLICQEKKYPNANKLKWRNHHHKAGLIIMFDAVRSFLRSLVDLPPSKILLDKNQTPWKFVLTIDLSALKGEPCHAEPQPPLHFSAENYDKNNVRKGRVNFQTQFEEFAQKQELANINKVIEKAANFRNELLYAQNEGMPGIEGNTEKYILGQRDKVAAILVFYCMIAPYKQHQLFVAQCIEAYHVLFQQKG